MFIRKKAKPVTNPQTGEEESAAEIISRSNLSDSQLDGLAARWRDQTGLTDKDSAS